MAAGRAAASAAWSPRRWPPSAERRARHAGRIRAGVSIAAVTPRESSYVASKPPTRMLLTTRRFRLARVLMLWHANSQGGSHASIEVGRDRSSRVARRRDRLWRRVPVGADDTVGVAHAAVGHGNRDRRRQGQSVV